MASNTYIIFGASGGIGTALVRLLSEAGAELILAGRNQSKLESLAKSVKAKSVICDAVFPEQVEQVFNLAETVSKKNDGVVNLAGSLLLKPAHLTSDKEWQDTLNSNLTTAFNVLRCNEASLTYSKSLHALGRIGQPNEIASIIAWLLSEKAGWVTGQIFSIDGGLASTKTRSI